MAGGPKRNSLELATWLSSHTLASGTEYVYPLAEPDLASFGARDTARTDQQLFLTEYLSKQHAEVVARFALPKSAHSIVVNVKLTREDLPRSLPREQVVAMHCAVLPHRVGETEDRWVVVLPLAHTVHVGKGEDLEEKVCTEVERFVAALELSGHAWLALLPPREHELVPVGVTLQSSKDLQEANRRGLRREMRRDEKKRAVSILKEVGRPLHGDFARRVPTVYGRDTEVSSLEALLGAKDRLSIVLVGEELVGKSAVFHAWLARAQKGDDAPFVFATSGAQLVAGQSIVGQWQERIRRVFEAAELLDAVIYFDDFGDLFADRVGSYVDLARAIRPYLDQRRVRLAGELTPEALDAYTHSHAGFFASLAPVRVAAQSERAGRKALEARLAWCAKREPKRPRLSRGAVDAVLELTGRYLPYRPFPGKAVRLFEELRDVVERDHLADQEELKASDVYDLFSVQSGIPAFLLREDKALKADQARRDFYTHIIGQRAAIEAVVDILCVVKAGLQPPGKPLATLLFAGPTGVGKTELARRVAIFLFGSASRLVRFDMSEFTGPASAQRLISGHGGGEGLLTQRIRQQPFSVILLDEIEKAHPSVYDLLLQVFGEGRLTDSRGRTAHFHNAIFIMTSNLGTAGIKSGLGVPTSREDPQRQSERHYENAVVSWFRPEFVNRLDRIIPFAALSPEEILRVAKVLLDRMMMRRGLLDHGITLDLSDAAHEHLAAGGYSPDYGARALRRHIEDTLVAPLSAVLSGLGQRALHASVQVSQDNEEREPGSAIARQNVHGLRLEVSSGSQLERTHDTTPYERISSLRRSMQRWLELPRVEEVRERMQFLMSQLTAVQDRDPVSGPELSAMSAEYHRIKELWDELERLRDEVLSAEELGLAALLAGERSMDILQDTEPLEQQICRVLLKICVSLQPRHAVTLRVQELDDGRGTATWLPTMLRELESRDIRVDGHVAGQTGGKWPAGRLYGPSRSKDELSELVQKKKRDRLLVLLRCTGEHAGDYLSMEAGLHRILWGEDVRAHWRVDIATFSVRLSDKGWENAKLMPPPPPFPHELRLEEGIRELDYIKDEVRLLGGKAKLDLKPDSYWSGWERVLFAHILATSDGAEAPMLDILLPDAEL